MAGAAPVQLLRRAALAAAETSEGRLRVTDEHVHVALAGLRRAGDELTHTLLGGSAPPPGPTRP